MKENLGDWCKWLEKNFSLEQMIPKLPVIIRLDGVNFSNYTKRLDKPFDIGFQKIMVETLKKAVYETNAIIGYTQSDEMTLILYQSDTKSEIYHNGKKQKILSKLSAFVTNTFNDLRRDILPTLNQDAIFDCRIFQVPTLKDACLQLVWRERDATKNSISALAQKYFSPNELDGVNSDERQNMLLTKHNVNWNDLPLNLKRGVYVKRIITDKKYSEQELNELPIKHHARKKPELLFTRKIIKEVEYPILSKIINLEEVIFNDCSITTQN